MKLTIIGVGSKMPAWVEQGYNEYVKRLPRELTPKLIELPLAARSKTSNVEKTRESEGQQILSTIDKDDRAIMLDVLGRSFATEKLAEKLQQWQMDGRNVALVIGGPDGLSQACLERADERWSLSPLTLPHPLVRVLLAEQLYRAWTITQHHPYHK